MQAPTLDEALGGPTGDRALRRGTWYSPAPWAFGVATLTWLLLMVRQLPCLANPSMQYSAGCYSDITALWGVRGFHAAAIPYLQADLEYPVLTGVFIYASRLLSGLISDTWLTFFGVNGVLLFACFLALVAVHLRIGGGRAALLLACSPLVLASGLINWDLLPVLLTSAALLAWGRGRPTLSGVLIGLGAAAKLYPALALVPIVVLCVRSERWRPALQVLGGAAAAWLAVNVPVFTAAPEGWLHFWTFNSDRGADLGSVWLLLEGQGLQIPALSAVVALLMVGGTLGISALMLFAPVRPRVAQGAFLMVLLFCLLNKVYSPQYMLWLLPLLVLARPVWRDWVVFTFGEVVYWLAVWAYLDGHLYAGDGSPRLYWLAIAVRVGVQLWLGWRVVGDVLDSSRDPVDREADAGVLARVEGAPAWRGR
ncbi:MAG: glycosyltransferase family 87 protein [Actinomycetes bacterium]